MSDLSDARIRRLGLGMGGFLLISALVISAWAVFMPPRIDRTRVYRIGYGNDAPLHYRGPDGQATGLAVELVQAAARQSGIKLEWINLREMGGNDIDFWVLKSIIPDQPSDLYNTEPYLQAESCFLVQQDSPVQDVADLIDHRVSYVDYRIHRETLPNLLSSFQAVPVKNSREAVDAMINGQADAAYIDQYTLFSTLLSGDREPLRVLPTRSPTRDMALAARPHQAAVADEIRSVDRAGQAGTHTTGDELDERRVVHDEVIARGLVAAALPAVPVHRQLLGRIGEPGSLARRGRRRRRGHARGWAWR